MSLTRGCTARVLYARALRTRAARTLPVRAARALGVCASVVAGLLGVLAALLALAGPAAAHADLVSSSPRDGAVLTAQPRQAVLVFSEKVTPALSSVTVVGPDGRHLVDGPPRGTGTGGTSLAVTLSPDAARGTFILTWRTTASDDGHTTTGAVVFSVGAASRTPAALPAAGRPDRFTDAIQDTAVWLGLAGLALLVGFAAIRLYCVPPDSEPGAALDGDGDSDVDGDVQGDIDGDADHDEAPDADGGTGGSTEGGTDGGVTTGTPTPIPTPTSTGVRTDLRTATRTAAVGISTVRWPAPLGWAVLLAGTLLQLLVYGPAARGASPAHLLDRSMLSTTLSTHMGHTLVARIMLLAVVAAVGDVLLRHRAAGAAGAAVLTLLLALTWSEISHAPSGGHTSTAIPATTLHVTAMAVWAGGMATLAVLLARAGGDPRLGVTATRFSRLALGCAAVLAATGLYQAFREVGSLGALTGTHYGRLLLVKVALFALVIAVAAVSRARVRRRPDLGGTAALRRAVVLELAGVTGVLIVTVLLISTAPAH